jgi:hypothetical protein
METITHLRRTNEHYLKLHVSVLWELEDFNDIGFFEWDGEDEYSNPWYGESSTINGEIKAIRL